MARHVSERLIIATRAALRRRERALDGLYKAVVNDHGPVCQRLLEAALNAAERQLGRAANALNAAMHGHTA